MGFFGGVIIDNRHVLLEEVWDGSVDFEERGVAAQLDGVKALACSLVISWI
jgi:hypothetical protein